MPVKSYTPPPWRQDVLKALTGLCGAWEDVQTGQMMGHPAFYYAPPGGKRKMFACAYGPGVGLKLPPERCAELLEEPGYMPFIAGESVMGGWIVYDPGPDAAALADAVELLQEALDWTGQCGRKR
jgi:hypothetical protein